MWIQLTAYERIIVELRKLSLAAMAGVQRSHFDEDDLIQEALIRMYQGNCWEDERKVKYAVWDARKALQRKEGRRMSALRREYERNSRLHELASTQKIEEFLRLAEKRFEDRDEALVVMEKIGGVGGAIGRVMIENGWPLDCIRKRRLCGNLFGMKADSVRTCFHRLGDSGGKEPSATVLREVTDVWCKKLCKTLPFYENLKNADRAEEFGLTAWISICILALKVLDNRLKVPNEMASTAGEMMASVQEVLELLDYPFVIMAKEFYSWMGMECWRGPGGLVHGRDEVLRIIETIEKN